MHRYEYQAYIPGNRHDSWSRDHTTNWMPEDALRAHLGQRSALPGGNEGVVVYRRVISPAERVEFEV